MKHHFLQSTLLLFTIFLFISCGTSKSAYNNRFYKTATLRAIKQLNKQSNNKIEVDYLESAFAKYSTESKQYIQLKETTRTVENTEAIWRKYTEMQAIQNSIQKLLPLYGSNKEATFILKDYSYEINTYKNDVVNSLLSKAQLLLLRQDRFSAREAQILLNKVIRIQPNHTIAKEMISQANNQAKCIVYIQHLPVTYQYTTDDIGTNILEKINNTKLNYSNTYFYKNSYQNNVPTFIIAYKIDSIIKTPENETITKKMIKEKTVIKSNIRVDNKGTPVLDKMGFFIIDTTFKIASFELTKTSRQKSISFITHLQIRNVQSGQIVNNHFIKSDSIWMNTIGSYSGNTKYLLAADKESLTTTILPYPTNETLVSSLIKDNVTKIENWLGSNQTRQQLD